MTALVFHATAMSRRQVIGLMTIVLLHVLVLWQLASQRHLPEPIAPQSVTSLRLYPTAARARDHDTAAPAAAARQAPKKLQLAPRRLPSPAVMTDIAPQAAEQAPAGSPLDIDTLKRQARDAARESGPASLPALHISNDDKAAQAIARAARPKCDNDYKPQIGNVKFEGLAKIPFLVKGAASDSGCKW